VRQITEFVAVLACGLFTWAAVYTTFVEHSARMECRVEIAATEFAPSYRRATVMQASLAAVELVSSIAAWLAGASIVWVVAGVLLGSVIPFTLIVILPTNKQLLNPSLDKHSGQTERLLTRWGRLHAVREKHPQYSRALAIPLARRLHKIRVTGEARMVKGMKRPFVAETGRFPSRVNTWNPVPQNCRSRW
jgi:hypothetical protein